ncbi:hypothetical protein IC582_014261 [Cucumis melo]
MYRPFCRFGSKILVQMYLFKYLVRTKTYMFIASLYKHFTNNCTYIRKCMLKYIY